MNYYIKAHFFSWGPKPDYGSCDKSESLEGNGKTCILLKFRCIIYNVIQYINHRVYDHFNLSYFSLQKPQCSTRGIQCIPFIKANKLKYNLSNYTASVSVRLPRPKCKPCMCCKCIIIRYICLFGHCFALWPRNALWYMLVLFSTNSSKCSPEQPVGSQVNQLVLWPHWHTYYCFFCLSCCYRGCFLSPWLGQYYCIIMYFGPGELGLDKMEHWFSQAAIHLGFHSHGPTTIANCHQLP